jgi:hypothetical protein
MNTQGVSADIHKADLNRFSVSILLLILFISAWQYFLALSDGLPLITIDEGNLLMEAYARRGLVEYRPLPLSGYPPLIFGISTVAQWVVERITGETAFEQPTLTIYWIRLFAMCANLLTIIVIFQTLRRLHSVFAGLLGGLAWAVSPAVFDVVKLALTEPFHIVLTAGSMLMLVYLMQEKSARYAIFCTLLAALAVIGKYPNLPVLGLGVGGVVALMIFDGLKWWRVLIIQSVLIAVTGLLIYYAFGVNSIDNYEVNNLADTPTDQLLVQDDVLLLLDAVTSQVNLYDWRVFIALIALGTVVYLRKATRENQVIWIGLLVLSICLTIFPATFIVFEHLAERYASPASPVNVVLVILSVVAIFNPINARYNIWKYALLLIIGLLWLTPPILQRASSAIESTYTNTLVEFIHWAEVAIPGGTTAIPDSPDPTIAEWLYFDRVWAGYDGPLRPWVVHNDIREMSQADLIADHVRFLMIAGGDAQQNHFVLDFNELLSLKQFPAEDWGAAWTGDTIEVYQLWRPSNERRLSFGGTLDLVGYDLTISPDRTQLTFEPYWQLTQPTETNYQLFAHLTRLASPDPLSQQDVPLSRQVTSDWADITEIHIGQPANIQLPPDVGTADYVLRIGVYDGVTGERLRLNDGETAHTIPLSMGAVESGG